MHMSNGCSKHLLDCKHFTCLRIHFKCPDYYCIPWRYVCNSVWDCPYGVDEEGCNRSSCPGMFKCHTSVICLTSHSICDQTTDCKFGDDEYFCKVRLPPCPQNCTCIVYSITCTNYVYHSGVTVLPYIIMSISSSHVAKLENLFQQCNQTVLFFLRLSKIKLLCGPIKSLNVTTIMHLDFAMNIIKKIERLCFSYQQEILTLNLSLNRIEMISELAFFNLTHLQSLDLSSNKIQVLSQKCFTSLHSLKILKILNNCLVEVSIHAFEDSSIGSILTDDWKVCCISKSMHGLCQFNPQKAGVCMYLIGNSGAVAVTAIIALLGLVFNTISFVITRMKKSKNDAAKCYDLTVIGITIGDMFYCIALLIIFIANSVFQNRYIEKEIYWRGSVQCYIISTLYIASHLISFLTVNIMAVSRYSVVKYPFDSRFLERGFVIKLIVLSILMSVICSICMMMSHWLTSATHLLPNQLCRLLDGTESSVTGKIAHYLILATQFLPIISTSAIYFCLYQERKKSGKAIEGASDCKKESSTLTKGLLTSSFAFLCWIPGSIGLILVMFWTRLHFTLILWLNNLILPLNAITNPFTFVFIKAFKDMKANISIKNQRNKGPDAIESEINEK